MSLGIIKSTNFKNNGMNIFNRYIYIDTYVNTHMRIVRFKCHFTMDDEEDDIHRPPYRSGVVPMSCLPLSPSGYMIFTLIATW